MIPRDDLRALEVDLSRAPIRAQLAVRKTLVRGSRAIAREMRRDARGHRHLPHLDSAVSWDLVDPLTAEIGLGPRAGTQGSLAHIIAYGSAKNAPVYDHTAAFRRVAPLAESWFADAAEGATLGGAR